MPLLRDGRPLKRWRYVGVYGAEGSLCAGTVRIGPAPQTFWAVWDRAGGTLHERTRLLPGGVDLGPFDAPRVRVRDRGVEIDVRLEIDTAPWEVVSPHGGSYIWTRKLGARAVGTAWVDGRRLLVDAPAIVDDSAGYHARRTAWRWSAGAGSLTDGRRVLWNLVDGVHDGPSRTERAVWVDGVPHEVGPVTFAPGLGTVGFSEGGALRCEIEAVRARTDRLGLVSSDYEQPFGAFSGALPGAGELASGFGVMERHEAMW
jgi:hypothetical protein